MLKKLLCVACSLAIAVTAVGCGKAKTSSSTDSENTGGGDFMSFSNATGDTSNASTTSGNNSTGIPQGNVSTDGSGNVQVKVERPNEPKRQESVLANKNYKGKNFKILYWYTPDDSVERKVKAFNKAHNANLKIEIVNGDPNVAMAKSIAGGKPYDIVANHGDYFPQTIFQDIYEPLESYISKDDMYSPSNSKNGGLLSTVNDRFAWGGHYYALGSAKSIYQNLVYYNKKLFKESGLEDPWELYKKGQWNWDKVKEMSKKVTDLTNGVAFFTVSSLNSWNTINAVEGISFNNGVYSENIASERFIQSAKAYQDTFLGNDAMALVAEGDPFISGKLYLNMNVTDSYTFYANKVKVSSAFGRKVENLGTVPVPYGPLNTEKKYPGHAAQGYSATKGCSDPSVAACYALFESRWTDNSSTTKKVPTEVLTEVQTLFANNGFLGYSGFKDSSGNSYHSIVNDMGIKIMQGADVVQTINNNRQVIANAIANSTKGK